MALMLHCSGTLQDLHRLQIRLKEGEILTFWDQSDEYEDLEVDATLHYLREKSRWHAEFMSNEIRYVPHVNPDQDFDKYPCYRCRSDLHKTIGVGKDLAETVCPECNLPVLYPMKPPND